MSPSNRGHCPLLALAGFQAALRTFLQGMTTSTRAEDGCRTYDLYESADEGELVLFERHRNRTALEEHRRSAAELLAGGQGAQITVDAIAQRAGVGKQTIYRWWPSKSEVLLDAMIHRAEAVAPAPDSGDLETDLRGFPRSTFGAVPDNRSLLLGVLREALGDPETMDQLTAFTAARRDALAQILRRAENLGTRAPRHRR